MKKLFVTSAFLVTLFVALTLVNAVLDAGAYAEADANSNTNVEDESSSDAEADSDLGVIVSSDVTIDSNIVNLIKYCVNRHCLNEDLLRTILPYS